MAVFVKRKSETKSVPKSTRRERKAHQTRQLILDAARKLFRNHPYEDVTMDDISEQADLSRATLYNYFDSKEAIYFEVGIQSLRSISEKQKAVIAPESSGLEQILKLSGNILKSLVEQPLTHEIMRYYLVTNSLAEIPAHEILKRMERGEEVENPSDIVRARYLSELRVSEKTWKDAIELGFKDGSIRHHLNADQLTHFLFMIVSGIFDRVYLERIPLRKVNLSMERLITLTIDLIQRDLETDRKLSSSRR